MNPRISFVTANFVARQLGYRMEHGWMQGDAATQAWFSPLPTFATRFDEMLQEVKALGFDAIDLWGAHLHWHWATLSHLDTAKALLAKHGLAVRSYATWVGGDAADLRAACQLCNYIGIPLIAGNIELVARNRTEETNILREYGVLYAVENHPEKNAAELRARIGQGDEDVVGVALDTGWCATQSWNALEALRELYPRLFTIHLKDVKAKRSQPSGLPFVDMGHETCRLGEGVVPAQTVVEELRRLDYRGSICIEHEPEEFDPREDCRAGLERVTRWWSSVEIKESAPPLRVAVVGCGNIANAYGDAMRAHPEIKIVGASDLDLERAKAWTTQHGGRAYASLDEVLADASVEAVVNLTIQQAHVEVVSRCLEAGKHVHSEKPLAPTYSDAKRLVDLAAQKGLRLSCAPVTWLGEAQQTAWKLIRDGKIGTPRVAYATVDWGRIEAWHPNPAPFYAVGPVFDVGVYPLSLLTAWFGPVRSVTASGTVILPERATKDGKPFTLTTEDWLVAVLEFAKGLRTRLTANFYVGDPAENRAGLEIHGDAGSLATAWFASTATVKVGAVGGKYRRVRPIRIPAGEGEWWCDWAAGVVGLWHGLRTNMPHPTTGEQAAHVVEIMESIHRSARERRAIELKSTFAPPLPQAWAR
jgi:predicted dehydrogenase/sugar phosphate isomerase/epimerase